MTVYANLHRHCLLEACVEPPPPPDHELIIFGLKKQFIPSKFQFRSHSLEFNTSGSSKSNVLDKITQPWTVKIPNWSYTPKLPRLSLDILSIFSLTYYSSGWFPTSIPPNPRSSLYGLHCISQTIHKVHSIPYYNFGSLSWTHELWIKSSLFLQL